MEPVIQCSGVADDVMNALLTSRYDDFFGNVHGVSGVSHDILHADRLGSRTSLVRRGPDEFRGQCLGEYD